MPGKKRRSCAAKRLQRKRQQRRKRQETKIENDGTADQVDPIIVSHDDHTHNSPSCGGITEEQPEDPTTQACSSKTETTTSTSRSIFDDKMFRVGIDEQDGDMIRLIKTYPIHEQCEELEKLFRGRTESMHYYMEKTDDLREEMYALEDKYQGKIQRIREFWKEKIYEEKTRPGSILKRALKRP